MSTVIWPAHPFRGDNQRSHVVALNLPRGVVLSSLGGEITVYVRQKCEPEPSPISWIPTEEDFSCFRSALPQFDPVNTDWKAVERELLARGFGVHHWTKIEAFRTIIRAIAERSEPSPQRQAAASVAETSELSSVEKALALLVYDPALTDTEIAAKVGVHRTTLYKPTWIKFQMAREALEKGREEMARGSRNVDGAHIEAFDNE